MYAAGVVKPGAAGTLSGGVYLYGPNANGSWGAFGGGALNSIHTLGAAQGRYFTPLPFGVVALDMPCSAASYNGRLYLCGGHSYNLVLDEHHRLWKQGIRPPDVPPTIAGAPGTTVFGYLSWFDALTDERSPLSPALEIGTGTPRTWSNLPTRPPDDVYIGNDQAQLDPVAVNGGHGRLIAYDVGSRLYNLRAGDRLYVGATPLAPTFGIMAWPDVVEANGSVSAGVNPSLVLTVTRPTHLELWLSIAGDLPRLAMRVPIGVTSVVESKGIADLGEAFFTAFQRFPRCTMNDIYHDRQIMAGDPENPDTLYVGELFTPERFAGLSFRTRDGRPITGILSTRDYALIFTRSSTYQLQGYTNLDLRLNQVDQNLGSVGHLCNTVIHGNPMVITEKGPYLFNGQWHPLSPENRWTPIHVGQATSGRQDPTLAMTATDDPYFNTYIVSHFHLGSARLLSPYNGTPEEPFGHTIEPVSNGSGSVITEEDRFFGVFDYTLVIPEAGGAMHPARVSFDSLIDGDLAQFIKYLRNRWAFGALFHVGSYNSGMDTADADGNGTPAFASYAIIAMQTDEVAPGLPTRYVTTVFSKILTGFDFLQELGAHSMESKTWKRFWFHMRARTASAEAGAVADWSAAVFAAPDPGWWDNRLSRFNSTSLGANFRSRPHIFSVSNVDNGVELRGDMVLVPPPDGLSGRGIWVYINGRGLQFHGYGGQWVWGADVQLFADAGEPV